MAGVVGVPPFGVLLNQTNSTAGDAPVVKALHDAGLDSVDASFRQALRSALVDRSFIYENRQHFPDITVGHLEALARLGGAFFHHAAMIEAYREPSASAGSMSIAVARANSAFQAWLTDQPWLVDSIRVGRGLDKANLPRKVIADLGKQFMGLLCLAGETAVAATLLADLFKVRGGADEIEDPRAVLAKALAPEVPSYVSTREGPDHAPHFTTVIVDACGRRAEGRGANKKLALNAAASAFINSHLRHVIPQCIEDLSELAGR